jgi:hypothetical protein
VDGQCVRGLLPAHPYSRRRNSTPQARLQVRWTQPGLYAPPLGLNCWPQISHGLAVLDPVVMPRPLLLAQGTEQNRCSAWVGT